MKTLCIKNMFLLFLTFILSSNTVNAQDIKYLNAKSLNLIGKARDTDRYYHRIDTLRYNNMPAKVKSLFTNSAGLAIAFKTNSNVIWAKWKTKNPKTSANMTAIAHKGLDLYIKRDGKWVFAGVGRPTENSTNAKLVENMDNTDKECLLYLPLYDEVLELEIGVTTDSYIESIPDPFRRKVIIYGSSILQGASASRPGMAYPAIMARRSGINFINLGLSGNGKMEKAVADMVAGIEADAYILDCAPNPSPEEITERTAYLVRTIRKRHPAAPIIMIQSVVREAGNFNNKVRDRVAAQNRNFKAEYNKLKAEGITDLYYIEGDLLGTDHEGTTDGVHPNDIGFERMLQVTEPVIMDVLKSINL